MIKTISRAVAVLAIASLAGTSAYAAVPGTETLRYDWRLRGGLSWLAGLKFPTSGTGVLQTQPRDGKLDSQLRVSAGGNDHIEYTSRMEASTLRTFASANGYAFGKRAERKESVYDYSTGLVRVNERDGVHSESKVKPLPVDNARDVLTTIAYLRENATKITAPLTTDVYADGKPYQVRIVPEGLKSAEWQGKQVPARVFKVVAVPGAKKKFPGMSVWISEDGQRLPLRIVIDQPFASLDLKLRG